MFSQLVRSWIMRRSGQRASSAANGCTSRPPRTACDHPLLNHLLRALPQRLRDREAQRLCGFQVDHQLELGWLFDGDVGGLRALENLVDEAGCTAPMPRVG